MVAPFRHVLSQGPMLLALGRATAGALRAKVPLPRRRRTPRSEVEHLLAPRPASLVEDFVREVGGDPARWRGTLPPHLFPQWGLPVAAEVMSTLPFPIHRMLNAACRLEIRAALPANESLRVRARMKEVDDDGRRVRLHGVVTTGTASAPDALESTVEGYLPLASRRDGPRKERPAIPAGARRVAEWSLCDRAGLDFAILTGDFNPLHWVRPYARMAGFKGPILHGYALLARALEALVAHELGGDPSRLRALEVRFTQPLPLPATAALFVGEAGALWMGRGPGEAACLTGTFRSSP